MPLRRDLLRRGGGAHQQPRRVARREARAGRTSASARRRRRRAPLSARRSSRQGASPQSPASRPAAPGRYLPACPSLRPAPRRGRRSPACQPAADRRGATVLFASGADLQSINPLLTPASARPTGAALRAAHHPRALRRRRSWPGRTWRASGAGAPDRRTLTLHPACRRPLARRRRRPPRATCAWTLDAARDPGDRLSPRSPTSSGLRRIAAPRRLHAGAATSPIHSPAFPTC